MADAPVGTPSFGKSGRVFFVTFDLPGSFLSDKQSQIRNNLEKRPGKTREFGTPKREPKRKPNSKKWIPKWVPFSIVLLHRFLFVLEMWILFVASVFCTAFPRAFGTVAGPIWRPNRARTIVIDNVFTRGLFLEKS